ncbi:MAG TPA: hypothetical protein VGZ03_05340 [Acidimicrobiales bacterium]|nr:hypothetical protein [Acidimicrobiales bacterium]
MRPVALSKVVLSIAGSLVVVVASAGVADGTAPGRTPDRPELLAQAGSTSTVYVLASCAVAPCLHLYRTADGGARLAAVTPPPATVSRASPTGTLRQLVFATPSDGLALEGPVYASLLSATFYATTNGARSWAKQSLGRGVSVIAVAATATAYFMVTARCPHRYYPCTGYRLSHSATDHLSWTSTALGNQAGLGAFGATIAAFGRHVWLSEATSRGAPVLASSSDGGSSFTLRAAPRLVAVTPCQLWASSASALWARCPTGMLVSFAHSGNGGTAWTLAKVGLIGNTSGGAYDPISASRAFLARGTTTDELYRVSGASGASAPVGRIPASNVFSLVFTTPAQGMEVGTASGGAAPRLERTSDGGASWRPWALPR